MSFMPLFPISTFSPSLSLPLHELENLTGSLRHKYPSFTGYSFTSEPHLPIDPDPLYHHAGPARKLFSPNDCLHINPSTVGEHPRTPQTPRAASFTLDLPGANALVNDDRPALASSWPISSSTAGAGLETSSVADNHSESASYDDEEFGLILKMGWGNTSSFSFHLDQSMLSPEQVMEYRALCATDREDDDVGQDMGQALDAFLLQSQFNAGVDSLPSSSSSFSSSLLPLPGPPSCGEIHSPSPWKAPSLSSVSPFGPFGWENLEIFKVRNEDEDEGRGKVGAEPEFNYKLDDDECSVDGSDFSDSVFKMAGWGWHRHTTPPPISSPTDASLFPFSSSTETQSSSSSFAFYMDKRMLSKSEWDGPSWRLTPSIDTLSNCSCSSASGTESGYTPSPRSVPWSLLSISDEQGITSASASSLSSSGTESEDLPLFPSSTAADNKALTGVVDVAEANSLQFELGTVALINVLETNNVGQDVDDKEYDAENEDKGTHVLAEDDNDDERYDGLGQDGLYSIAKEVEVA